MDLTAVGTDTQGLRVTVGRMTSSPASIRRSQLHSGYGVIRIGKPEILVQVAVSHTKISSSLSSIVTKLFRPTERG